MDESLLLLVLLQRHCTYNVNNNNPSTRGRQLHEFRANLGFAQAAQTRSKAAYRRRYDSAWVIIVYSSASS